jgi:hypothetical protein
MSQWWIRSFFYASPPLYLTSNNWIDDCLRNRDNPLFHSDDHLVLQCCCSLDSDSLISMLMAFKLFWPIVEELKYDTIPLPISKASLTDFSSQTRLMLSSKVWHKQPSPCHPFTMLDPLIRHYQAAHACSTYIHTYIHTYTHTHIHT